MASKTRVKFTFPPKLIKEPIIYNLGKKFEIVTNIRRAEVEGNKGWVVLELEGPEAEVKKGLDWVARQGVRVDPVTGDVIEG